MKFLKCTAAAALALALTCCSKPESGRAKAAQGFWVESSGASHAQIFGRTVIFSSISRDLPKLSYNIAPNGPTNFIVLDGRHSEIVMDDTLSSWSVTGVFGEKNKTFLKAPNVSTDDLNGRFQSYVQYNEFHTDWSEIIDRDNGLGEIDQLILYHHNMEFRRERFSESMHIKDGFILISERTQLGWEGSIIDEYYINSVTDGGLVLSKPGNASKFREIRHKRSIDARHPKVPEGYTHQTFVR